MSTKLNTQRRRVGRRRPWAMWSAAPVAAMMMLAGVCGSGPASAATKPTGKPIVLFTVADPSPSGFPGVPLGMDAAAKAINAAGGVKDPSGGPNRPIKVVDCDDSAGANASANCGREAVSDNALAVVGSQTANGPAYEPIVYNAGIPLVAEGAYDTPALTNALSFPVTNTLATSAAGGVPFLAASLRIKSIYVVEPNLPQATSLLSFLSQQEKAAGVTQAGQSLVNESSTSTPDYTPYAAAAASSHAGLIYVELGPSGVSFLKSLLTEGVNFKKTVVVLDSNVVSAQDLQPLGKNANGVYFMGGSIPADDTSNPAVAQYNNEMDRYGNKTTPRTEASEQAWVGVHVIANLLKTVPTISSAALVKAMNNAGPMQVGPIVPFNWSKHAYTTGFLSQIRIFANQMMVSRVVNGKAIPVVETWVPTDKKFTVTQAGQPSS
jgi:ABC-type branched-subunit amino acid transport system substrate-binding protein